MLEWSNLLPALRSRIDRAPRLETVNIIVVSFNSNWVKIRVRLQNIELRYIFPLSQLAANNWSPTMSELPAMDPYKQLRERPYASTSTPDDCFALFCCKKVLIQRRTFSAVEYFPLGFPQEGDNGLGSSQSPLHTNTPQLATPFAHNEQWLEDATDVYQALNKGKFRLATTSFPSSGVFRDEYRIKRRGRYHFYFVQGRGARPGTTVEIPAAARGNVALISNPIAKACSIEKLEKDGLAKMLDKNFVVEAVTSSTVKKTHS
jgi:hypothetical protein